MNKIVLKFGGTSVESAVAIKNVVSIIINHTAVKKVVVVSAFSGVTNTLYKAWESLLSRNKNDFEKKILSVFELTLKICTDLGLTELESEFRATFDDLLHNTEKLTAPEVYGLGEEISSMVLESYISSISPQRCELIKSREYIFTKGGSLINELESGYTSRKMEQLSERICNSSAHIFVLPGFVATDSYSRPSVLGRGGSDFTAAVVAAGINADRLEIWTDVSGMLTADPKLIDHAKEIKTLTFKEASELAYFGAKVLHPKTILPVIDKNIPVLIKNTKKIEASGTVISDNEQQNTAESTQRNVKAISSRGGITIVNIVSNRMLGAYGFMKKVFEVFDEYKTPVDLVTTTEVSVSVTIDDTEFLHHIIDKLDKFSTVAVDRNNASVSIIGEGLGLTSGVAASAFTSLKGINIKMVSFGANDVNLSLVVSDSDKVNAVILLHKSLIEG